MTKMGQWLRTKTLTLYYNIERRPIDITFHIENQEDNKIEEN